MHAIRYLQRSDFVAAAREIEVDVEVVKAVAAVEARNSGFIKGTDLPAILFEGHHFHRLTGGRHAADYPHLSYPTWTKAHYKGGRGEYDRLVEAIRIHAGNPEPALLATSWGMFQIMGFNHREAGFATVVDFVNAMSADEGAHLKAFVSFVRASNLVDKLRDQRWADFARGYNGPGYKQNSYDTRMAAEFARARTRYQEEQAGGVMVAERGDMVAIQTALNAALGDALEVKLVADGWMGNRTEQAIRLFRRKNDLPETGAIDAALCKALGIDIGESLLKEVA